MKLKGGFNPNPPCVRPCSCGCREDVITEHIGIHNESESLNFKPSYFDIIGTIQSEFSHRLSEFNMSLIKSLRALSPASKFFLDKKELQPLCFSVNSTSKCTTVLWKALSHQSFLMCFWMKTPVWIWTSFWNCFGSTDFFSTKQLFPP